MAFSSGFALLFAPVFSSLAESVVAESVVAAGVVLEEPNITKLAPAVIPARPISSTAASGTPRFVCTVDAAPVVTSGVGSCTCEAGECA